VSLRRGELLFISGGNGSGKSTLLRLLTALYMPQGGEILVDGRRVDADLREAYQNLFSTVFSDFHLFQRLFGLGAVAPEEVTHWLDAMEIAGKTRLKDGQFDTIQLSTARGNAWRSLSPPWRTGRSTCSTSSRRTRIRRSAESSTTRSSPPCTSAARP